MKKTIKTLVRVRLLQSLADDDESHHLKRGLAAVSRRHQQPFQGFDPTKQKH